MNYFFHNDWCFVTKCSPFLLNHPVYCEETLQFIYMCSVFESLLTCRCQNVAVSHSIFALVCKKSTVFASCGVLAQLMDGCGHERIVHRRCQILGEYRAMSLCQLSGSPSRILSVEKGLALCGNLVVHHLQKIVVWSWWVHVRFVVGTVELRWVFSVQADPHIRG
jgi:hypothetical protein